MKLEAGSKTSSKTISWHEAEAEQIWIVDSFTWDHRFLSFRETNTNLYKGPGQRGHPGRTWRQKWLGGPQILCYPWMPYHSSPVGKTQGTLDPDLDPVI